MVKRCESLQTVSQGGNAEMSQIKSHGLGKGFDVLIPADFDETILLDSSDRVQKLLTSQIHANPDQPRKTFDAQMLDELASSIEQYGILQPLIVSPAKEGYTLVAGERRWRAAQKAGLKEVPVIVRERQELEQLEVALIENVQRVDLSPLEQAVSIERLHQQFSMTYQSIAKRLGKSLPTVHNIVRLLQLPNNARLALQDGKIYEGHARAILSLKDFSQEQEQLLGFIVKNGWSVRQAEQFAVSIKSGAETKKATRATSVETPATKRLSKSLGAKVTVKRTAKGGRIEIHYKTDEELEMLIAQIDRK